MHANRYSKSQFSRYAVAYSQCVPQPPTDISLSSPHHSAKILPKYAHCISLLYQFFLPLSPLLPLYFFLPIPKLSLFLSAN